MTLRHLSRICLLLNENLKPPKQGNVVFESLACLKMRKIVF